jgi:hypothetical protein
VSLSKRGKGNQNRKVSKARWIETIAAIDRMWDIRLCKDETA